MVGGEGGKEEEIDLIVPRERRAADRMLRVSDSRSLHDEDRFRQSYFEDNRGPITNEFTDEHGQM